MTPALRDRLLGIIEGFHRVKVLAVVDLVADEYVCGRISRVSREAPVLILDHQETRLVPGGGANAVNNIAALGGRPFAVGVVGNDAAGRELLAQLRKAKVDLSGVERSDSYPTPTKTRILAGGVHSTMQQVVRIDRVASADGREPLSAHFARSTKELLPEANVVMVSDYDTGLVTPGFGNALALKAASLRKRTVLDSRRALLRYRGFTSATPNEPEVEAALGVRIGRDRDMLERSGRRILKKLSAEALLVTRGSDGMALFEGRKPTRHIPVFGTDEVADVTGAGDTVISAYALALGAGASFHEAALLANCAGGIVVMKRGTATVSREELAQAVRSEWL
jgi:rfaE bifunctional protein kinase chain/domain